MLENTKPAALLLVIFLSATLIACGGGGGSVASAPAELDNAADNPAVVPQDGFGLSSPGELFNLIEPGREVSAVKNAGEYETGLPVSQVTNNGLTATLTPLWSPDSEPPLTTPAYCFYAFNIGDYTGPGNLTLSWAVDPFLAYNVWAGIGNRDTGAWDWTNCADGYIIDVAEVAPYATAGGDVLIVVLMTGTFDATLASVNFAAGDNEAPVADLVIAKNGGSTSGATFIDASGSTDSDGTITTYQWDFDGDGTWDESGSESTVTHTFAATGRRDVSVRVTDDRGDTDTAVLNIGVYDEFEDNDDGEYGTPTQGDMDSANALPAIPFSGFTGNCGAGGYKGDDEDFYTLEIPSAGWYTFIIYFIDEDADLEMALMEDDGDGTMTVLISKTSTSDNELLSYEITTPGTYYLRAYKYSGAPEEAVADYSLETKMGQLAMPTASFTATPNEGEVPLEVNFDAVASADSDGTIVLYEWDYDGDGSYDHSSTSWMTDHTYEDPGTYDVKLRVTDDSDLTATATRTVTSLGQPPVADLQADVTSGVAPLTVNLDASGSTDPEDDITNYKFDLDGNGTYEFDNGDNPLLQHDFIHGGTITVGLQVVDASSSTDTDFVDITCTNGPPTASVTGNPLSGPAPLSVTFDASASTDPNGDIIAYHWDWDSDGTYDDTSEEPTFEFIFFMEGNYTVTCQVEDGAGQTDTDTVSVTVTPNYSETEVNDEYTQADDLPAFNFEGWNGVVGPKEDPGADAHDWSKFTINSPGEIRLYMQLYDNWGDIDIKLFDTDGTTQLGYSGNIDNDEEIIVSLESAGTYYVDIYMFTSGNEAVGGYLLEASFTAD